MSQPGRPTGEYRLAPQQETAVRPGHHRSTDQAHRRWLTTAWHSYRSLSRLLQARSRLGGSLTGPDWVDPGAIESISLRLPSRHAPTGQAPVVEIALRDGLPGSVLPRCWAGCEGAGAVRLRMVRAARATAQTGQTAPSALSALSAPAILRTSPPFLEGTATALLRDRLAPDRNYLLTCGHVAAPDRNVRADELLKIALPGGAEREGRLAEWQPALGGLAYRTQLDAALVEVAAPLAVALQRDPAWLPTGLAGPPRADQPVTLRRRSSPLAGTLEIHWSGWVDLPGLSPGVADYFLADAVGYATGESTLGGDSGGALWDSRDRLLGMHIGAIPDAEPGSANAVLALIGPVLDWFSVQPYLRDDPASLAAPRTAQRVAPPPPPPGATDEVVSVVARTLWGEARGEGEAGMRAVAAVIGNRVARQLRGSDPAAVCLAKSQFSCWNPGDPNLGRMEAVMRSPDTRYLQACGIARALLAGQLGDPTNGATHYFASTLRQRPRWADHQQACAVIGGHEFYKNIA